MSFWCMLLNPHPSHSNICVQIRKITKLGASILSEEILFSIPQNDFDFDSKIKAEYDES